MLCHFCPRLCRDIPCLTLQICCQHPNPRLPTPFLFRPSPRHLAKPIPLFSIKSTAMTDSSFLCHGKPGHYNGGQGTSVSCTLKASSDSQAAKRRKFSDSNTDRTNTRLGNRAIEKMSLVRLKLKRDETGTDWVKRLGLGGSMDWESLGQGNVNQLAEIPLWPKDESCWVILCGWHIVWLALGAVRSLGIFNQDESFRVSSCLMNI